MTNDKLPEETQVNIKSDAQRYTKDEGYQKAYIAGATAWAPWKVKYDELNGELQKFKETVQYLTIKCDELGVNNHQLQERAGRMADALEEIKTVHKKYHDLNGDNPAANHLMNIANEGLSGWQQFKDGKGKEVAGRTCQDCGTYFVSNERCPECNPLG